MKIILTNWINIVGVFVGNMLCAITLTLADPNFSHHISDVVFGALFLVLGYGMMFWAMFIISLLVLDVVLIIPATQYLKAKLIVEWVIISLPFIYWTVVYKEWVFAAAVISFLIAQLIREKLILK